MPFIKSSPFGWAIDEDGFRGHVFTATDNSSVIVSIKGTTLTGSGPTAKKDRFNDNRYGERTALHLQCDLTH